MPNIFLENFHPYLLQALKKKQILKLVFELYRSRNVLESSHDFHDRKYNQVCWLRFATNIQT